jgi:hypothetical protein
MHHWRSRTLCEVLSEMRTCHKTHNYAPLESLIEEVQIMGNRMEAGLDTKRGLREMDEEWSKLRKELTKLEKQVHRKKEELDANGQRERKEEGDWKITKPSHTNQGY